MKRGADVRVRSIRQQALGSLGSGDTCGDCNVR